MKGPLQAIRRRRAQPPAPEAGAEQAATEAPTEVQPAAADGAPSPEGAPATDEAAQTNAPAGQDPAPGTPTFRNRGRLRRRLRYLRRVRELGFRDLGGLVFDQHRFSQANEELVRGKVNALTAVDQELRTLEHALDDRRPITELREPGISVCPRCGALHGSEARYCPSCGVAFHGPLAIAEVGDAVSLPVAEVVPAAQPEPEPQPASTHVAEAEAAKVEPDPPPTEIMAPPQDTGDGNATRFVHQPSEHSQP
jgi:ribosomal protein L40E